MEAFAAPIITIQPNSVTVNLGTTATFTVVATGTGLTYQWKKNGLNIAGGTTQTLSIPAVIKDDNGAAYSVVISNSEGSVPSLAARLTVGYAPVILKQPDTKIVNVGQPAAFSVLYDYGNLDETVQWFQNGTPIVGATKSIYTIPALSSADHGKEITVVISNSLGSVTSETAFAIDKAQASAAPPPPASAGSGAGGGGSGEGTFRAGYSDNYCDVTYGRVEYSMGIGVNSRKYQLERVFVRNCEIPVEPYMFETTTPGSQVNENATVQAALQEFPKHSWIRPGEELWEPASDAAASIASNQQYNASRYEVEVVFGSPEVLTGFPQIPDPARPGSFKDDRKTYVSGIAFGEPVTSARWFAKVKSLDHPEYFGLVSLFPGFTDGNHFNKPIVVGDAYDPQNKRSTRQLCGNVEFRNLLNSAANGNFLSPRYSGYDIFFIDFVQGAGNLHINAGLELKFIEWLQLQTSSEIIVGGPSMSGIIARLALLYSKPENNVQHQDYARKVKGYISIDSPHQGAEISANLQSHVFFLKQDWLISNVSDEPQANWDMISTPGTHQMLYEHYYNGQNGIAEKSHDDFYQFLKSIGNYRNNFPSIGIAYSNFHDPSNGFTKSSYYDPASLYYGGNIHVSMDIDRKILAGKHEFEPGSVTDATYFSPFKNSRTDKMFSSSYIGYGPMFMGTHLLAWSLANDIGGAVFAPTFIPIKSALDISVSAPDFLGQNPSDSYVQRFTPFTKTYFMHNSTNGYCNSSWTCSQMDQASPSTPNNMLYQHIIFDGQLMTAVNSGLAEIEKISAGKKAQIAIRGLLLK